MLSEFSSHKNPFFFLNGNLSLRKGHSRHLKERGVQDPGCFLWDGSNNFSYCTECVGASLFYRPRKYFNFAHSHLYSVTNLCITTTQQHSGQGYFYLPPSKAHHTQDSIHHLHSKYLFVLFLKLSF